MKLEELLTDKPEFFLTTKNKSYSLRVPNLEDRARFREWLGDESKIQKVFNELQWDVIAKLVYRLMVDKSDFIAREEDRVDDDGVRFRALVTGPALLMQAVTNIDEATKMMGALVNALRLGDPLISEAVDVMVGESQKKSPTLSQTGQNSLMPSPQNTVTPLNSSAH